MGVTPDEAIETLQEAMAGGVMSVTYSDGRSVKYRTTDEMRKDIAYFRAQKRSASGGPVVRTSVGAFFKD